MSRRERLYVSTGCLKGDKSITRVVDAFRRNGVERIELTGVHGFTEPGELEKLLCRYREEGVRFTFHNYFPPPPDPLVLNFLSRDEQVQNFAKQIISNAAALAERTGTVIYAFHPGYYRDADIMPNGYFRFHDTPRMARRAAMEAFRREFPAFYQSLGVERKNQSVYIGIENLFPNPDGSNDSFMCTLDEISELFDSPDFASSNIGLLIDLGHLAISANLMGFDREAFLGEVTGRFGDRIYEVHISENDQITDLHNRVHEKSWQLRALRFFEGTGSKVGGTIFTIESRGMTEEQVAHDYELVKSVL